MSAPILQPPNPSCRQNTFKNTDGQKGSGQLFLLKAEHRRVLLWQQDIQLHSTELT